MRPIPRSGVAGFSCAAFAWTVPNGRFEAQAEGDDGRRELTGSGGHWTLFQSGPASRKLQSVSRCPTIPMTHLANWLVFRPKRGSQFERHAAAGDAPSHRIS